MYLPTEGLQVRCGGANDRLVFLSHSTQPDWSLYTPDRTILRHPVLASNPAIAAQLGRARLKRRIGWYILAGIAAVFVLGCFGVWLARPAIVDFAVARIPVSWEKKMGETAFAQIRMQTTLIEDRSLLQPLEQIAQPLLQSIPNPPYKFQLHLAKEPVPNAFALPGGHVVVNSGLIVDAKRPEEVAGVLAHEIAHVMRRHSLRNLVSNIGLSIIMQTLFGDFEGLLGFIADNSSFLLRQSFSREYEHEADNLGWDYLMRANIDPSGLKDFFERLREKGPPPALERSLAIMSTHPATDARIRELDTRWQGQKKKSEFIDFDLDFAAYREKLRGVQNGSSGKQSEQLER